MIHQICLHLRASKIDKHEASWFLRLVPYRSKNYPKNPTHLAFENGSSRCVEKFKALKTISATPHPVQMLPIRIPPSLEAPFNKCCILTCNSGFCMKKSTNSWTFKGPGQPMSQNWNRKNIRYCEQLPSKQSQTIYESSFDFKLHDE